jgi:hypothetical protein
MRLGHDADAVMKMSAQHRIDAVKAAGNDGHLDRATVEMLARMGIVTVPQMTEQ